MLRPLYDWTMRLSATPRAAYALGAISFAESSFFPIPPDALLVPMVIAERRRAWSLAFICTTASVLGAVLGYAIGALFFEEIAEPLLAFYGYADKFTEFAETYNEWGVWIVLMAGLTPFPFKVVTVASGATGLDPLIFILSSVIARGIRFYAVAALLYRFGAPVRAFIEKRLGIVFTAGIVVVLGSFIALRMGV
ncbi:MAG: YqaA family protein [Shinella sp.]|nr:YqaA family protein [Shinella sp.]